MVRKLALAVSLALGTASVPVYALGLGELSSKSLLNQNFEGNIGLLSVKPDEIGGVRVKLGDAEAFSRAGVERPFYLSLLKFEPLVTGSGKPVIRVTSDFPIREPFLNFLIEVNWPKGRLLREYTVLLDPPTTTARRAPNVTPAQSTNTVASAPAATQPETRTQPITPVASAAPTASIDAAPAGDASEYGPVKANDTAWSLAKQLRPGGVSMEQMMMALLAANPQAFINGNINRLRRGQILRVPAIDEIRELSRQQARAAYRQQQDEWLARRDERLQKAAEQAAINALPGGDATSAEGQVVADQLRIATSRPDGEGQAGADDGESGTPTAPDLQSRLILARENAETSRQETVALRSQVDDLQARLADMQKLLSLKDDQLAQLQDRVVTEEVAADGAASEDPAALAEVAPEDSAAIADGDFSTEDPVPSADVEVDSEVILDAEDIGVAPQIESDLSEAGDAVSETVEGLSDADVAGSQVDSAADDDVVVFDDEAGATAIDESQDGSIAIDSEASESFADESFEAAPGGLESAATGEPAAAETDAAVGEAESLPPTTGEVEPAAPEAERGGLLPAPLARIFEEHTLPIAAGGAGLVALIAGLLFIRRRRESDEPEPLLAGIDQEVGAPPAEADTAIAEEVAAVETKPMDEGTQEDLADSAFLDEFSPSDINALQDETGEVDPVSEADVYIAYGRYQQAEELLGQAMEQDQGRLALKHKLLEVHYATRNTEAYCDLAGLMVEAGQDGVDEAAWARAREMGRELAPDNELFALKDGETELNLDLGAIGAATAVTTAAVADSADADSFMLDESELTELTAAYGEDANAANDRDASSDADVSILLDLEDASELVEQTETGSTDSISISTDELESMEFQLPEVDKDGVSEDKVAADDSGADTLDLDSMMAEAEAAVDREDSSSTLDSDFSADDLQAQLDELSDLSVLDSELGDPSKQGAAAPGGLGLVSEDAGPVVNSGLDAPLDLDDAFDAAEETGGLESIAAAELGTSDDASEAGEDIATKLDLARAYVEIGDDDGARSILAEVVAEGNDSQRGDAKQLLSSLG